MTSSTADVVCIAPNARLIWSGDANLGFFDENEEIAYTFGSPGAQTPEPASALLLGTGAAFLMRRYRRGAGEARRV